MGWLSSPRWDTKQAMVDYIVQNFNFIDHAVRGKVLYGVYKHGEGFPEGFGIIVCLLDNFAKKGCPPEWGYKDMGESCYPYYFDCPEKILSRSTNMEENAVKWRQACRDKRKAKTRAFEPVDGSRIRLEAENLPSCLNGVREWTLRYNTAARLIGKRPYWSIHAGHASWKVKKTWLAEVGATLITGAF